jgi:hypothetical protein
MSSFENRKTAGQPVETSGRYIQAPLQQRIVTLIAAEEMVIVDRNQRLLRPELGNIALIVQREVMCWRQDANGEVSSPDRQ